MSETPTEGDGLKSYGYAHVGTHQRLPGVYLDEVLRREAEINRAKLEGREPDLDNPSSIAGTPLVPVEQLPDTRLQDGDDLPLNQDFVELPVYREPEAEVDTRYVDQVAIEELERPAEDPDLFDDSDESDETE